MSRCLHVLLLLVALHVRAETSIVTSVLFRTTAPPPAMELPRAYRDREPLFRAGLQVASEPVLVLGALAFDGGGLGLSAKECASLTPLATEAYTSLARDPSFAGLPSALPFCFSAIRPTNGHYFLIRPATLPREPQVLAFLHGHGGNFQFYSRVLKEQFPEAVILAPSWGLSWARGDAAYLREALADASRRLGTRLDRPWLIGLSAGAYGGFRFYADSPAAYRGYIALAGLPSSESVAKMSASMNMLLIAGVKDSMLPIAEARQAAAAIKRRVPGFVYREVPGDHFFFLGDPSNTCGLVRGFVSANGTNR